MSLQSDTPDPKELESLLRQLSPKALDLDLLDRLEQAADGSLESLSLEEMQFEASLRRVKPSALPENFFNCLEQQLSSTPFPVNKKILLFPKAAPEAVKPARFSRSMWSAAAAVAILGASAALLLPNRSASVSPIQQASNHLPASVPAPLADRVSPTNASLVPAGFERGLNSTRDEGIYWDSSNTPHRVLRVEYMDHYIMKSKDGKTYTTNLPRTQYILVPEKVD
ncbi:hypothetical protein JIN85_04790 [Luteolibacter pohnpeiensis]|uniref:Uncharacterized protein n=1 Tax=Luteolibacter pohnpeiensis TaxID=454153 RepID=A0A934SAD2_9BACT|nr:hypothetical protein [Luteolibacter pohnpeiensis]MBK1881718.1 hypothetical protein [Luteolibacter pohnpeiensis]